MAVDVKKMRKRAEEAQRGGEFLQIPQGQTKCYVHGVCREGDEQELTKGLNYIPLTVHYQVGKNDAMVVCLDPDKNPIVKHPFVRALLKKRKHVPKLDGTCPVCEEIEGGGMESDEADESRPQQKALWGITKIATRQRSSDEWRGDPFKPSAIIAGRSIHDGLMGAFGNAESDISDVENATLVILERKGKGKNDTRYKVELDAGTLRKPVALDGKTRKVLQKAMVEGGDCDLFKIIANLIKGVPEVRAALSGVKLDDDEDDDDVDTDAEDTEEGAEDEDEHKHEHKKPVDDDDDDDDEDSDDEDEDDGPKAKKKKPVDDDDDADEGDSSDDDEDEPKTKKKKKPVDDDDDDDGESSDDEDDEGEKPKGKKKPVDDDDEDTDEDGPKAKKKKPADDDEDSADEDEDEKPKGKKKPASEEDDDLGLDALDEELERISTKKAKGKGK
jgi:hypothetical protein